MKNKIGIASAIFDKYGLEEAFRDTSEIGIKYIELVNAKGFIENIIKKPEEMTRSDIDKIMDLERIFGVDVYAISVYFYLMKENAVPRLKKVIEVAREIGIYYVITDTGEIGMEEDDKKAVFFRDIIEIAEFAESKNITLCFEIHGGWYSNGKQVAEIIKKIDHPNVRLNYDTGNAIYFGDTRPEEDLQYAIPYMGFMHLKDKSGKPAEWNFPALGDGDIDFSNIFSQIKDYSGPMSIEVELTQGDHTLKEINEALRRSSIFLKNFGYS